MNELHSGLPPGFLPAQPPTLLLEAHIPYDHEQLPTARVPLGDETMQRLQADFGARIDQIASESLARRNRIDTMIAEGQAKRAYRDYPNQPQNRESAGEENHRMNLTEINQALDISEEDEQNSNYPLSPMIAKAGSILEDVLYGNRKLTLEEGLAIRTIRDTLEDMAKLDYAYFPDDIDLRSAYNKVMLFPDDVLYYNNLDAEAKAAKAIERASVARGTQTVDSGGQADETSARSTIDSHKVTVNQRPGTIPVSKATAAQTSEIVDNNKQEKIAPIIPHIKSRVLRGKFPKGMELPTVGSISKAEVVHNPQNDYGTTPPNSPLASIVGGKYYRPITPFLPTRENGQRRSESRYASMVPQQYLAVRRLSDANGAYLYFEYIFPTENNEQLGASKRPSWGVLAFSIPESTAKSKNAGQDLWRLAQHDPDAVEELIQQFIGPCFEQEDPSGSTKNPEGIRRVKASELVCIDLQGFDNVLSHANRSTVSQRDIDLLWKKNTRTNRYKSPHGEWTVRSY